MWILKSRGKVRKKPRYIPTLLYRSATRVINNDGKRQDKTVTTKFSP